jgi:PKD repeat protein
VKRYLLHCCLWVLFSLRLAAQTVVPSMNEGYMGRYFAYSTPDWEAFLREHADECYVKRWADGRIEISLVRPMTVLPLGAMRAGSPCTAALTEASEGGGVLETDVLLYHFDQTDLLLGWATQKGLRIDVHAGIGAATLTLPVGLLAELSALSFVFRIDLVTPIVGSDNFNLMLQGSLALHQQTIPYQGQNIHIGLGDDGPITDHIDLKNRLLQEGDAGAQTGLHGELMAGIIAGAGNLDPKNVGAAPYSTLHIYAEKQAVNDAILHFANENVLITNTSLSESCNRGYTAFSAVADRQLFLISPLMHVFSAGNAGSYDCLYGAGLGWGTITGGTKTAKNAITVGNIGPNMQVLPSSSRGPTADGRIKPDLVSIGDGLFSMGPNNNYLPASGTSASAASVTGALAQLYGAWQEQFSGVSIEGAVIKAALLNTADEVGAIGPDYLSGWGSLRADKALEVIENEQFAQPIIFDQQTQNIVVPVPTGAVKAKLMLYWADQEGDPTSTDILVNDLDMEVTQDGAVYLPWALSKFPHPDSLNAPASTGHDHRNNVEQVVINNLSSGDLTIKITGYDLPYSYHKAVLIWCFEFGGMETTFPKNQSRLTADQPILLHWEAATEAGIFEYDFSNNNGLTWDAIGFASQNIRTMVWAPTSDSISEVQLRLTRNGQQDIRTVTVTKAMPSPIIDFVCPDSIDLHWFSQPGVTEYQICRLDQGHMQIIKQTQDTFAKVATSELYSDQWFAVAGVYANGVVGSRSVAVLASSSSFECPPKPDLAVISLLDPTDPVISGCDNVVSDIVVKIKNMGLPLTAPFEVFCKINNEIVSQVVNILIPPDVSMAVTFENALPNLPSGLHEIKAWVIYPYDLSHYNDTVKFSLTVLDNPLVTLPEIENTDNQSLNDETAGSCTFMELGTSTWINEPMYIGESLDWRVASSVYENDVLPQNDQNLSNANGNYLALIRSPNCYAGRGSLVSPCFAIQPGEDTRFVAWVMFSGAPGERIHVDVFSSEGGWQLNELVMHASENEHMVWVPFELNIVNPVGATVSLRIRGYTGLIENSFILLDNLVLHDALDKPIADFKLPVVQTCTEVTIPLEDNSINAESVQWVISPNNFDFMDGTDAFSQNPKVKFSIPGQYSVKLIATNSFGTTELLRFSAIQILPSFSPPMVNNFEPDAPQPLLPIEINNPDNAITWAPTNVPGLYNQNNLALYLDNYGYSDLGQRDGILSTPVHLQSGIDWQFLMEYAYAPHSPLHQDELTVAVQLDCRSDLEDIVLYDKKGYQLATATATTTAFEPNDWKDWETLQFDLDEFSGHTVRFRISNTTRFGNNLFIDNLVIAADNSLPKVAIDPPSEAICLDLPTDWSAEVSPNTNINWHFPPTANLQNSTANPVNGVYFLASGSVGVRLAGCNFLTCTDDKYEFDITQTPAAAFDYVVNGYELTVNNESQFGQFFNWEFGDGASSDEFEPNHIYSLIGNYPVTLTVDNTCGQVEYQTTIYVSGIVAADDLNQNKWLAYPNPTDDQVVLVSDSPYPITSWSLSDASGRTLRVQVQTLGANKFGISLADMPVGLYWLRAIGDRETTVLRLVKY